MHNRLGITTANELARAEKATAAAITTAILENVEPNSWRPSLQAVRTDLLLGWRVQDNKDRQRDVALRCDRTRHGVS